MEKGLARFGVSLEKGLLDRFDRLRQENGAGNRSQAIRELIRERLVQEVWALDGGRVTGVISLVYGRGDRRVFRRIRDIQQRGHGMIVSCQRSHLDSGHCLEIVVASGEPRRMKLFVTELCAARGVLHGGLTVAPTGSPSDG